MQASSDFRTGTSTSCYPVNLPVWVNGSSQCTKLMCVNLDLVRTWSTVAKIAATVNVKKLKGQDYAQLSTSSFRL